jgi:hypothetical protein
MLSCEIEIDLDKLAKMNVKFVVVGGYLRGIKSAQQPALRMEQLCYLQ